MSELIKRPETNHTAANDAMELVRLGIDAAKADRYRDGLDYLSEAYALLSKRLEVKSTEAYIGRSDERDDPGRHPRERPLVLRPLPRDELAELHRGLDLLRDRDQERAVRRRALPEPRAGLASRQEPEEDGGRDRAGDERVAPLPRAQAVRRARRVPEGPGSRVPPEGERPEPRARKAAAQAPGRRGRRRGRPRRNARSRSRASGKARRADPPPRRLSSALRRVPCEHPSSAEEDR